MGFKTLSPEERKTGWTSGQAVNEVPIIADPGPGAVDPVEKRMSTPTPGETQEDVDIWQGATDRGSGPEFQIPSDPDTAGRIHDVFDGSEMLPITLKPLETTLPPEVLAQLQRIEDYVLALLRLMQRDNGPYTKW